MFSKQTNAVLSCDIITTTLTVNKKSLVFIPACEITWWMRLYAKKNNQDDYYIIGIPTCHPDTQNFWLIYEGH